MSSFHWFVSAQTEGDTGYEYNEAYDDYDEESGQVAYPVIRQTNYRLRSPHLTNIHVHIIPLNIIFM